MLIIDPFFCFSIGCKTALVRLNTDLRLTVRTLSHWSSVILIRRVSLVMPALFTRMSIFPKSLTISFTTFWESSKSAAFEMYPFTVTLCAFNSWIVFKKASSSAIFVMAIDAPSAANLFAIAFPIPRLAPVIKAVLPSSSLIYYLFFDLQIYIK